MAIEIILKKERENRKLVFQKTDEEKERLRSIKLSYREYCRRLIPGWRKRVEGQKTGTMNPSFK